MSDMVKIEHLKDMIVEIRGHGVLLDSDVAQIYGVGTRDINKAVANNPDKFPAGYIVELSKPENGTGGKFPPVRKTQAFHGQSQGIHGKRFVHVGYNTQKSSGNPSNHINHRNLHKNPRTIEKRKRTFGNSGQNTAESTDATQRRIDCRNL